MKRVRRRRARIDGIIHTEIGRITHGHGAVSHYLRCSASLRYDKPDDAQLGEDVAVTCLWCAREPL